MNQVGSHCMLIGTFELCVSTLVCVTLILIQGYRDTEKQKLLCWLSSEGMNGFGWNLACY